MSFNIYITPVLSCLSHVTHILYTFHVIPRYLDLWFGPGNATNDISTIEEFKNSPDYEYTFGSAVGYKLITFEDPATAILSIRGTQTVWDLCADAQLWLSAMLFQGLRFVLPVSAVFTPILNQMVWIVSHLESDSITRVAFYRETTGFVKYLTESKEFQQIQVTGHSLGEYCILMFCLHVPHSLQLIPTSIEKRRRISNYYWCTVKNEFGGYLRPKRQTFTRLLLSSPHCGRFEYLYFQCYSQ